MPSKEFESLPNIYLVGPMGAGKTTVGRHLAELLGREFLDSDHEIERKTGATIPWIFEKEGEQGFRSRETVVIDELTSRPQLVLATGGGAVTQAPNREYLKQRGIVVYLYTPVEIQLQRTYRDKNRPLLQVENPAESDTSNPVRCYRYQCVTSLASHVPSRSDIWFWHNRTWSFR